MSTVPSRIPSGILWDKRRFYKRVQFVEQDVGHDGAYDPTLRYPTQRLVERPIFHIPCVEEFPNEVDKSSIMNMLAQRCEE